VMKKYPHLEGKQIWEILQQWNDQVLVKDK
jgi:hypothetical protein